MENQKDLNEMGGGGELPNHLKEELYKNIPQLMKPVVDYCKKVYAEYAGTEFGDHEFFKTTQKMSLKSLMHRIVDGCINDVGAWEPEGGWGPDNSDDVMMNEAKEKLKSEFKRYL